jgi:ribosomal protein S18 acetylase RimI-like enzyme
VELGFRKIVSEVELRGSVVTDTRVTQSCVVRRSLPSDQPIVEKIAATSFQYDRFHADAMLDKGRADLIKMQWVATYFERESTKDLWVAERDRTVLGFCLAQKLQQAIRIDLIAVAPISQGLGIGSAMVTSLPVRYGAPIINLVVGTQKPNERSIRLYMKIGMNISHERVVFHRGSF